VPYTGNCAKENAAAFITCIELQTHMARIKVDLHDIYNNTAAIDKALQRAFDDAIEKKIREVEIIPGKGSGQLRKKVERFLQQPHIKKQYHRIENDSKNFGRLFVYFKF
jgi:dsDNA-specific endonuclease/ATPase MutS2